jgi:hypothetical protein
VLRVFEVMLFVVGTREVVHFHGRAASSYEAGIVFRVRLLIGLFPCEFVHRASFPVGPLRFRPGCGDKRGLECSR